MRVKVQMGFLWRLQVVWYSVKVFVFVVFTRMHRPFIVYCVCLARSCVAVNVRVYAARLSHCTDIRI